MESGETNPHRPVSSSTWASSSVTIDTGRGSNGSAAAVNAGSGSCSAGSSSSGGCGTGSPEVFVGGEVGAGCRPSSPLRNHLTVQQQHLQQQQHRQVRSVVSPAGRGDNDDNDDGNDAAVISPTIATTTTTISPTLPSSSLTSSDNNGDHNNADSNIRVNNNNNNANHNINTNNNDDDLLPLPALLDSNAPKSLLCIWAFVRSFFVDLFSILFNPVWLLLTMFTVGEVIVVDAFIVFGPKYIQTVFNVDASSANILSGK